MALVEDFKLGSAHIMISNDCVCVSREEAKEIIKARSKKIQSHISYMEHKREAEWYKAAGNGETMNYERK